MHQGYRGLLAFLRFTTYVFLILTFLQPSLVLDRMIEPKSHIAILVDSSRSMELTEKGASSSYLDTVADATGSSTEDARGMSRNKIVEGILNNQELDLIKKFRKNYFFSKKNKLT